MNTKNENIFRVLWVLAYEKQQGSDWLIEDDLFKRVAIKDITDLEATLEYCVKEGLAETRLQDDRQEYTITTDGLGGFVANFKLFDTESIAKDMQKWVEAHVAVDNSIKAE